jgi:high-affinity nickel-transport protein
MMPGLQRRLGLLIVIVTAINVTVWASLAVLTVTLDASVLAIGALSYLLGLQHGFDADHIAAIDNVTRKLRQDGQRPVATGLFFAAGHSAVVIAVSAALVLGVGLHRAQLAALGSWGAAGRVLSASFLTLLGIINLRIFQRLRAILKEPASARVTSNLAAPDSRLLGFLYRSIDASWKMLPLGFLFGLGFDTASEIAMLGLGAEAAASGRLPLTVVMLFPLMFTAGMTLVDAADGVIMMRIYDWAFSDPVRKLFFNTVVTGLSAAMALAIAALEWLQSLSSHFALNGPLWVALNHVNFSSLGLLMAALLLATWLLARRQYRRCFAPAGGLH